MGIIMHNNIPYGGGSTIEPNPQESATEQLETLGIDGDVYEVTDADAIHTADVGTANGVAELDANGKVPSAQLPSYVDDVLEYASRSAFPATGESGKIYVALDTNLTYRWSGSDYVEISPSLALGETSSTAYRGDRGKIAYDHSQSDHSTIAPAFTEASTRANIASGETIATIFGKIKKFFSDLKTVAFTGAYSDLSGTPTIPAAQVNSDWNASSGVAQILNKPTLATVATSGSYNDLSNKPTIPTVNNGTLTIQKNGTQVATFTANQSGNATANITVPDVSETDTTDSAPYLYRASKSIGDRCYLRQLVGASFGVNQLATFASNIPSAGDGITYTASESNSVIFSGTVSNTNQRSGWFKLDESNEFANRVGHKVLFFSRAISGTASKAIKIDLFISTTPQHNIGDTFIKQVPQNYRRLYWSYESGCIFSNYRITFNCIDLTQMFGTAIADKAYTLETQTAGSGIAWLKSYGFFTESYYPYNTGSLQSVQTSGKVNVGKNLFDNKYPTANSFITADGSTYSYSGWFVSDYIRVPQNTKCTFNPNSSAGDSARHAYYDADKHLISVINSGQQTFITPLNCYYMRFSYRNNSSDIQLELGEQATTYEPYTTHTTRLPNIELRGVPKLVDNNIVYDGDVRDESGTVTRKYKRYNLGAYNWTQAGTTETKTNWYTTGLTDIKKVDGYTAFHGMCTMFSAVSQSASWQPYDMALIGGQATLYVCTPPNAYSDATQLKAALSGVYLDAEIETPYTEQTTPIQNPGIYNKFGWEQFIDDRSYPIPVGHNSEYVNLPDWMEDGYYKDFRQRVDETLPNAISALANTAVKVIAKNGEYDAGVWGFNDMPNCSLSLDKGTYLIMAWCYFTAYNIDTNKEYGCAICDSSNTILSYDGHRNRTEDPEGYYGATSSTFILETITADATVRKLRGYMCKSVTGNPIKGGIVAFKIA